MTRFIVLFCLLLYPPISAPAQTLDRDVWTDEDLTTRGVVRLNDLLRLADQWDAYFIDEYTWNAVPDASPHAGGSPWTILINDQPVDVSVLGHVNLNTLPIHRSQIDSVVVHHAPTLQAGQFAPAGTIAFYTRTPRRETQYRFDVTMGNEIGDPGPFQFTDRRTVNIDRIGPNGAIDVTHEASPWHGRMSLKGDTHHATDARIRQRVFHHYDPATGPPRRILFAPRLELDRRSSGTRHHLQTSYVHFLDLYRAVPLGYEIPTRLNRAFAGVAGMLGSPAAVQYRLSYTGAALRPRENRRSLAFDWHQDRMSGHVSSALPLGSLTTRMGISTDYRRSRTSRILANAGLLTTRIYGQIALRPTHRWRQEGAVFVTSTEGIWGMQALTIGRLQWHNHRLHLALSWSQQPYAAQNSLWYWIQQGYELPGGEKLPLNLPNAFTMTRTFTADAGWHTALLSDVILQLNGRLRRLDGLNLAVQQIEYDAVSDGLSPQTTVHSNLAGTLLRGTAELQWHLLPTVQPRLFYRYQHTLGDMYFVEARQTHPAHRLSADLHIRPSQRFSLHARLSFRSPTRWHSFAPANRATEGRYPSDLPAYWTLDATVQKRLWQDHLLARLSLRNVLNEPLRLHPAGAVSNLMLFVGLQVDV